MANYGKRSSKPHLLGPVRSHAKGNSSAPHAGRDIGEGSGWKVQHKTTAEFEMPEESRKRFEADPAFRVAFDALTPGRQRGYLLHFTSAKQSKTKETRIEKAYERIFEGNGLDDEFARHRAAMSGMERTGGSALQPCDRNRVETFDYSRLSDRFSSLGKPKPGSASSGRADRRPFGLLQAPPGSRLN